MWHSIFGLLSFAATVIAGLGGYLVARNFVRNRLRFVDGVRSPAAPLVAGLVAFALAWPLALLPVLTVATAWAFGIGTALGTASGVRGLNRADWRTRQLNR